MNSHQEIEPASNLPPISIHAAAKGLIKLPAAEDMAGSDEKIGDEEKHQNGDAAPFDLNDFTVIKEGEAEILMHVKNEVFYNRTQVLNCLLLLVCFFFFFYS